jgi:hypothetical protein
MRTCKADPPNEERPDGGVNYGKPCVPVLGSYDGQPIASCLYCSRRMADSFAYDLLAENFKPERKVVVQ